MASGRPRGDNVRKLLLILALLACPALLHAQNTSVTATVTDPNGNPYVFSTGYAALVCPGNAQPTFNGFTVPRTFTIIGFDGFGSFTQVVYDVNLIQPTGCGYQWHIVYKDGVTAFITGTITTVTGASVNESAAISAFAVPLPTTGGGLTSLAVGNLIPLFTSVVTHPTGAASVAFTLSSAAANQVFGNCTGAPGPPAYCTITAAMIANAVCAADTQIIYNNAGVCSGSANLTWNNGTSTFSTVNIAASKGTFTYVPTTGSVLTLSAPNFTSSPTNYLLDLMLPTAGVTFFHFKHGGDPDSFLQAASGGALTFVIANGAAALGLGTNSLQYIIGGTSGFFQVYSGGGPGKLSFDTASGIASAPFLQVSLPSLFAAIPACTIASEEGQIASVTDSTTNTWGATITGTGGFHVLAYCDGTNWTVMGK